MLGQVLRQAREAAKISQQDAALLADMDRAYISEVENGKRSLSVDRLLRISSALNVRAADIIAEIEKQLLKKRTIKADG